MGIDFCMEKALWKHTKKPVGNYCDRHKKILEKTLPDNWFLLNTKESEKHFICLCAENSSK